MFHSFDIVHGAWSGVTEELRALGHSAQEVNLPGRNAQGVDLRSMSFNYCIAVVIAGKKDMPARVTLVCHRFGGFTILAVAYSKTPKDNNINPSFQDIMIAPAGIADVSALDKKHSAPFTQSEALVSAIIAAVA
jgi:hypothetical protein